MINNRGYLILDTAIWLILGGLIMGVFFATTIDVIKTLRWATDRIEDQIELIALDQSILHDLERGKDVTITQGALNINGVLYRSEGGEIIREYQGTDRTLVQGQISAFLEGSYLMVEAKTDTAVLNRTYRLFWR